MKLTLLEDLPDDNPVTIIDAAGIIHEVITTIPLYELDHSLEVSNLASVYIPLVSKDKLHHTFSRLRELIATLRCPNGCEWDKAQTHESLREYLVEEVYEVIDAIDDQDDEAIIEELGDVLLQVMLHSQIGEDDGYFTVDEVIQGITNKMIHRHPHVFSNSTGDISQTWDELKQAEKSEQSISILSDIPKSRPALAKACKIHKKVAKVGFDWDDINEVWLKLDEEIRSEEHTSELQ